MVEWVKKIVPEKKRKVEHQLHSNFLAEISISSTQQRCMTDQQRIQERFPNTFRD